MISLQSLSLFVGLCRHLHFGRTADEYHVTPSALSRSIRRLEDEVGHQLLIRDNRSVELTPQGKIFREFASETLSRFEQTRVALGLSENRLAGTLSLFASVTASQLILPNVLSRFRAQYPDIHLQLETGYAVDALQRLSAGADVVVAALPEAPMEGLERLIVTSTPMLTVAPADLALKQFEAPVDFSRVPLILPSRGQARDNIDDWLAGEGIRPVIYTEVEGNEATLSLVALGCGIGFVPELVLRASPLERRVKVLDDGPKLSDWRVGFCTRRKSLANSPLVRAFWDSVQA